MLDHRGPQRAAAPALPPLKLREAFDLETLTSAGSGTATLECDPRFTRAGGIEPAVLAVLGGFVKALRFESVASFVGLPRLYCSMADKSSVRVPSRCHQTPVHSRARLWRARSIGER
jgi:hypothetical protein